MNFAQNVKPQTTIKVDTNLIPTVTISEQALNQMFTYTKEVSDEVGWLGTAYKRPENSYHIEETFLFDQEVHATTTEITPEGLNKFAEELLSKPGGVELWNDIKMWGHSHVNMGTSPSAQDDTQMREFSNVGHDFFIRLICNKKGDLRIDVYDYANGLTFLNVAWEPIHVPNQEEEALQGQINDLVAQVNALQAIVQQSRDARTKAFEEPIKKEIKAKVKKFTYRKSTTSQAYWNQGNAGTWGNPGTHWDDSVHYLYDLEDYFVEKEIQTLAEQITTRPQFSKVLKDMGYTTLLEADITRLYSQLIQYKFLAGGKVK